MFLSHIMFIISNFQGRKGRKQSSERGLQKDRFSVEMFFLSQKGSVKGGKTFTVMYRVCKPKNEIGRVS